MSFPLQLSRGARDPQLGDGLAWAGDGWEPRAGQARPHNVTHVHTDTTVRVVMGLWRSPDFVSGSSGWQFDAAGSLEANDITARGTIYAEAGEIAGWTIAAGHLYAGSGAARVGLMPGSYPFYAGAEAEASAPFRVNAGGEVWATNAHIAGEIDANSGHLGTLDVDGVITVGTGTPVLQIDGPNKRIQSSNFASGISGLRIENDGDAEFGNVSVRGSLHCAVFVKDLISAHAGTLLVTKSAGKLTEDFVVQAGLSPEDTIDDTLKLEEPPGGGWLFDNNDRVRIKEEYAGGVNEIWFYVLRISDNRYFAIYLSGDDGVTYHKGTAVVDYGASGDGGVLQTGDLANAPYVSVFTHAGSPWAAMTEHLRLGNLHGTGPYSSDEYGIFIGDYAGDKWLSYDPTNSLRIRGDGIIDGTLEATKFSVGMGDALFNAADGLLLLNSHGEINATEWWSQRRQKATISGAFHQEAGRWPNTRGVMIEEGTTNIIINPSCETNITGYGAWLATLSHTSTQSRFGTHSCKAITTGNDAYAVYQEGGAGYTTVVSNTRYAQTWWIHADSGGDVVSLNWWEYDAGNTFLGAGPDVAYTLKPGWQKLTGIAITRATCVKVRPVVQNMNTGHTYYLDGLLLERKDYCTSHCDGSLAWCSWTGAAHASTSTRTRTDVCINRESVLDISECTLIQWMYFDASEPFGGWPDFWFLHEGGSGNERVFSYYDRASNLIVFANSPTGATVQTGALSLSTGWHQFVWQWKRNGDGADDVHLYIDAELEASSSTYTLCTTWTSYGFYVGGRTTDAFKCNAVFDEIATFSRVLTAADIAGLYALQRPLVDAGAMEGPGIYILDGKFKMASSTSGNRIEIDADEIAGYNSAGTKQFYLQASDGGGMFGGGKGRLTNDGLSFLADGAPGLTTQITFKYDDSGTERTMGQVYSGWGGGGAQPCITWVSARRDAGSPWPAGTEVVLVAQDAIAGTEVRLEVHSAGYVLIDKDTRIEKGLMLGALNLDPNDGELHFASTTYRLRRNGTHIEWYNGSAWVQLD